MGSYTRGSRCVEVQLCCAGRFVVLAFHANVILGYRLRELLRHGLIEGHNGTVGRSVSTAAVCGNADPNQTQRVEDDAVKPRPFR
jgi:hypothetical protein